VHPSHNSGSGAVTAHRPAPRSAPPGPWRTAPTPPTPPPNSTPPTATPEPHATPPPPAPTATAAGGAAPHQPPRTHPPAPGGSRQAIQCRADLSHDATDKPIARRTRRVQADQLAHRSHVLAERGPLKGSHRVRSRDRLRPEPGHREHGPACNAGKMQSPPATANRGQSSRNVRSPRSRANTTQLSSATCSPSISGQKCRSNTIQHSDSSSSGAAITPATRSGQRAAETTASGRRSGGHRARRRTAPAPRRAARLRPRRP